VTALARRHREEFRVLTHGREVTITAPDWPNSGVDNHLLRLDRALVGRADKHVGTGLYRAFLAVPPPSILIVGHHHDTLWAALCALVLEHDWRAAQARS
jgi:hypothetical protein